LQKPPSHVELVIDSRDMEIMKLIVQFASKYSIKLTQLSGNGHERKVSVVTIS